MALNFGEDSFGFSFSQSDKADIGISKRGRIETATIVVAKDGTGDFEDIQEAINSLQSKEGFIQIKEGVYNIENKITIPSKITIKGAGTNTIIKNIGSNSSFGIFENEDQTNGNSEIFISDLKIQMAGNGEFVGGINFDRVTKSKIQNCFFENCAPSILYTRTTETIITNNIFNNDNHDTATIFFQTTSIENLITNNSFIDSRAFDLDLNSGCDNNKIIGNNTEKEFFIHSSYNQVIGNESRTINIHGDFNIIKGNLLDNTSSFGALIELSSTSDRNIINGNITINNSVSIGIEIKAGATKNIITSNIVYNNSTNISDSGTGTIVANNITT